MRRKCEQCRYYNYCFRYKPRKDVKANAKRKTK
nr:MAG TPA: Cas system-associated protein [Caudoviricetes sp.]